MNWANKKHCDGFSRLLLSTHGGISRAELSKITLNLGAHDLRQFVEIKILVFSNAHQQ